MADRIFSERRKKYRPLVERAASEHGLPFEILDEITFRESRYDPRAVSPVGAQGLMQLMPDTASDLGVTNPFDPEQNINAGAKYFKGIVDRFGGDYYKALAGYNWGPNREALKSDDWLTQAPQETQDYVTNIMDRVGHMDDYSGSSSQSAPDPNFQRTEGSPRFPTQEASYVRSNSPGVFDDRPSIFSNEEASASADPEVKRRRQSLGASAVAGSMISSGLANIIRGASGR